METDSDFQAIAKKMVKGKKIPKVEKSKEPTDAMGWLKKAYIDNDPADGAPKVGDIGYV
jgi:hypothetical protein